MKQRTDRGENNKFIEKLIRRLVLVCAMAVLLGCPGSMTYAAEGYDQVASGADTAGSESVSKYGMTPIRAADLKDGAYEIEVETSSKFFRVDKAILTVKKGKLTADLTLSSISYKFVYPGTAEAAAQADLKSYIKAKDRDGQSTFRVPVTALNKELPCAAFSKRKKMWYDRTILLDASTLPEEALTFTVPDYDRIEKALDAYENGDGAGGASDSTGTSDDAKAGSSGSSKTGTGNSANSGTSASSGGSGSGDNGSGSTGTDGSTGSGADAGNSGTWQGPWEPMAIEHEDGEFSIQVDMTGGSGRASVTSPTWLIVKNGKAWARLMWSSTYYDYMIAGGKKYMNETTDGGNSTFTIPIPAMDEAVPVIADTTAMGDPVEIEYELTFYSDSIGTKNQIPQEAAVNVLIIALIIIGIGGILNFIIKRRKKQ